MDQRGGGDVIREQSGKRLCGNQRKITRESSDEQARNQASKETMDIMDATSLGWCWVVWCQTGKFRVKLQFKTPRNNFWLTIFHWRSHVLLKWVTFVPWRSRASPALTLCEWNRDDHSVPSSHPQTVPRNQERCDSHKGEAQLACTCPIKKKDNNQHKGLPHNMLLIAQLSDYMLCRMSGALLKQAWGLAAFTKHLADVRFDVHVLQVLVGMGVVET